MINELKCCGKKNPLGVDKQNIRLSFALDGSLEITRCQISVWHSETGKTVFCREQPPEEGFTCRVDANCVQEKTQYRWNVTAYLADGNLRVSETASFETGLDLWQGKWITGDAEEGRVLAFSKEITLENAPKKARLYICGLGYFAAQLNGGALDESYFIPPVTNYTRREELLLEGSHISTGYRVTYYTYDVTDRLAKGSNSLYVEVAGGYYNNREKYQYEPQPDVSYGEPRLIYELHIEDEAGCTQRIISDAGTSVRGTNAVSRLYSGDRIDFTHIPEPWKEARIIPAPDGHMTSPSCQEDRLQQVIPPVKIWETPEGTVYDFGVNHTGGLALTVYAPEETTLTVRFAEVLNPDGTLNYETAAWGGKHVQTDETKQIYQQNAYRLKPGRQEIAPKFSWFCYRYALIPANTAVKIEKINSLFIYMDARQDGAFSCSEELLNRINDTFLQTLRSNMHSGLVMDCPHRERLPYTGDGKQVMKSACYNLDALDFYYKWFRDILDAQTPEGLIPNSAPYLGGGGGYAWGNALCTVTQMLYSYTGDLQLAREGYDAIIKWLDYYRSKADENHIIRSNSHTWMLGDWLAPEVVTSNVYYISTVCYLQAAKTALFLAQILEPEACEKWEALIQAITDGINRVFFHKEKLIYGNGVQGENMLALAEGIVPEQYRQKMNEDLWRHYAITTDYHLDTGIVLTPVLIDYLTDSGYRDIAWRIMTAKTYPSYYSLMEEDTTFSEHWSKKWPDYYFGEPGNSRLVEGGGDLSHCHPMYGSVASWLYERVAGLDLSQLYQKIVNIKPYFMENLEWAKANKKTAFGEVSVEWSNVGGKHTIRLCIPQGLKAHCRFPAGCRYLQSTETDQIYHPDRYGYFDFTLAGGCWNLTN